MSFNPADPFSSGSQVGGDHYNQGTKTSPWDLQMDMKSSGSLFIDSRRSDAIKYVHRDKGDMLENLKKARHCIDAAIKYMEKSNGL